MEETYVKTQNKIIMEYTLEYVQSKQLKNQVLDQLNFVRLKKQLALPFELVGTEEMRPTESYRDIEKPS